METNSSTSHSSPAAEPKLTSVWLFIIGVLVIESLLRLLPEGSMPRTLRHRSEEIRYLPSTNIQFMGDSATSAVRVALIEPFLGKPHEVSNYSLPGTSPLFSYFILHRQLEAGKVPKVIIFAPHPFTWGDPFIDRFIGRFATPAESASLLRDGVDFDDWLYGTFCRMSYTLRYREELYGAITKGDDAFFRSWSAPISSVQNTRAKIAEYESPPAEPKTSSLDPNNIPPLCSRPISIHPYNELYLDKFLTLAEQHGIRVVWLTLPIPEMLQKRTPGSDRTAAYDQFVQRMSDRHPNLFPLRSSIVIQPDSHYKDFWHQNTYGAWLFSKRTGEQLAAWLKEHPIE